MEESFWLEEEQEEENHLQFLVNYMKSKILALSNNKEFQELIKKKRISNKYITIYFGKLDNKDVKKLN